VPTTMVTRKRSRAPAANGDDGLRTLVEQLLDRLSPPGLPDAADELDQLVDLVLDQVRSLVASVYEQASSNGLSPREHEIARMVSLGHTNKAIAVVLDISVWTVSTHLRRIFAKLDVSSRAGMVGRLGEQVAHPIPRTGEAKGSHSQSHRGHAEGCPISATRHRP
jgi:DNA-binding CsgD family transcriptional regulator